MTLRIGLLSTARINAKLAAGARASSRARVVAVASRQIERAEAQARELGIERALGSYEALLGDPGIDAVYISLPNELHHEWTMHAIAAGKHVLCEKPFTMTAAEAERVVAAATDTGSRAIEAFHDHYHPLSSWTREFVAAGRLGSIRRLEAVFTGSTPFAANTLRHEPSLGGGALMDLGCYPVHWLRSLFADTPTVVGAEAVLNPAGADLAMDAELAFAGGVHAGVHVSMEEGVPLRSTLSIDAERGTLLVDNIVFPSAGHSIRLEIDGVPHAYTVAGQTTYDHQLEAVLGALRVGTPLPTEGADSVANMTVIDAIYAAAGFERPWA